MLNSQCHGFDTIFSQMLEVGRLRNHASRYCLIKYVLYSILEFLENTKHPELYSETSDY